MATRLEKIVTLMDVSNLADVPAQLDPADLKYLLDIIDIYMRALKELRNFMDYGISAATIAHQAIEEARKLEDEK